MPKLATRPTPSTASVHKRKPKCRSCHGTRRDMSSPLWGTGDMRDIVVGYAPCWCAK